ncbi:MAG: AMP-binding protein [Ilumatobacteraceae bacterium]
MATYAELLLARADDDHVGLVFESDTWTWREVVQECADRAALLAPGDHVGLLLDNLPDYVFWLGACALTGATLVGLNSTRRGEQLAGDLAHTDVTMLLTEPRHLHALPAGSGARLLADVEIPRGSGLAVHPDVDESTRLLLLFTSGSTGAPKAVICSSGRLARIAGNGHSLFGLTRDDVLYQAMPMFHGNALMANVALATGLGATVVLRRTFSASGFLPDVRRHSCTYFNYVGRSLAYVLATPPTAEDADNQLRLGFGTEASARDMDAFTSRFGCPLVESYGSSEGAISIRRAPGTPRGALGKPPDGMPVAIHDEAGEECPRAEFDEHGALTNGHVAIGEIVGLQGASAFEGYYNNPEAEAQRITGNLYRTGDLGYQDAEGWFWFAGRGADWLRVDSENFAAAPVENILHRFPGAVMVAVYAVPDPRTGDQVMAAVEMGSGALFDPAVFETFLDEQRDLGTKWSPRFVRLVTEMPLTANNKINKQPLRVAGWNTPDPVWWKPARGDSYRPFSPDDAASLVAEFAAHDRSQLLPR